MFLIRIWYDGWSLSRSDITLFATVMIFNTYSTEWNPHRPENIYQEIKRCIFDVVKQETTMKQHYLLWKREWPWRQMLCLWKHRHVEKVFSPDWLHLEKRWDLSTVLSSFKGILISTRMLLSKSLHCCHHWKKYSRVVHCQHLFERLIGQWTL